MHLSDLLMSDHRRAKPIFPFHACENMSSTCHRSLNQKPFAIPWLAVKLLHQGHLKKYLAKPTILGGAPLVPIRCSMAAVQLLTPHCSQIVATSLSGGSEHHQVMMKHYVSVGRNLLYPTVRPKPDYTLFPQMVTVGTIMNLFPDLFPKVVLPFIAMTNKYRIRTT